MAEEISNRSTPTTRQVFESLYGRTLSDEEVFASEQNLVGFFNTLHALDQEQKKEKRNERHQRSAN